MAVLGLDDLGSIPLHVASVAAGVGGPLGVLAYTLEDLDAVVLAVGDVDPAVGVAGDVVRQAELAFADTGRAPREEMCPVGRVLVDPRVAVAVGDVDVPSGESAVCVQRWNGWPLMNAAGRPATPISSRTSPSGVHLRTVWSPSSVR